MVVAATRQLLVVDDELAVAEAHAFMLRRIGYDAIVECNPVSVEGILDRNSGIDMVMLDIQMPGLNGLELLHRIRRQWPHLGVVMATVINDVGEAVKAVKSGAYNYLLKPVQPERLRSVLTSFFENRPDRLMSDPRFSRFITQDPIFQSIFRSIRSFAETDVTILIQGETGTGKELAAHLVHTLSPRSKAPFVAVNVAALSAELFESELFGHAKGAYTGANKEHGGYFEAAGEGTLFLDEIGELGMEQQKKLLRVLQERKYNRLGETKERQLKSRIVMATNRDLEAEVKTKGFREDLYFRLCSYRVALPPLRDRMGDIELLANYFLEKYNCQFGRSLLGWQPDAMDVIKKYYFPGNVRELEGLVSAGVLLEQTNLLTCAALAPHVVKDSRIAHEGLEVARYREVMRVLAECRGNQSWAAKRLGVARQTLNRLLRKYRKEGLTD